MITQIKPTKRTTKTMTLPDDFKRKLNQEKDSLFIPRSDSVTKSVGEKILEQIKTEYKLNCINESMAVIAVFAQQGGVTKKCDGNMKIDLFQKTFTLAGIRKIFNQNGLKNGLRKFARTYASQILEIALILGVHGNLASKIQKLHPEKSFSEKEKIQLSEYHENNDDVPKELRVLIRESFKSDTNTTKSKRK